MIDVLVPCYVPFEPRTDEQRALRGELRGLLGSLRAGPEQILYASLAGPLPPGADVENALFYNLDGQGAFAGSMLNGVSFEVDPNAPAAGVRYRYEVVPAASRFRHWEPERLLASVLCELADSKPTLASIWWSLRSTPSAIRPAREPRAQGRPFAVTLEVEGPAKGMTPALLKCIIDGVVCGLQSQSDRAGAQVIAPLIAHSIGAPVGAITAALTDASISALGVRTRLAHAVELASSGPPTTIAASRHACCSGGPPDGDFREK